MVPASENTDLFKSDPGLHRGQSPLREPIHRQTTGVKSEENKQDTHEWRYQERAAEDPANTGVSGEGFQEEARLWSVFPGGVGESVT